MCFKRFKLFGAGSGYNGCLLHDKREEDWTELNEINLININDYIDDET